MGLIEYSRRHQYVEQNHKTDVIISPGLVKFTNENKNSAKSVNDAWHNIYKDTFTFKPKVSANSTRIVKGLGTDFITRQKQHIERRRQSLELATSVYSADSITNRYYQTLKSSSENHVNMTDMTVQQRSRTEMFIGDANQNSSTPSLTDPLTSAYTPHPPDEAKPESTLAPSHSCKQASGDESDTQWNTPGIPLKPKRSKTVVGANWTGKRPSMTWKSATQIQALNASMTANQEKLRTGKNSAEKAIKNKRIFTIQGPYPAIRESMRKRGWVEKFYKLHMSPPKKSPRVKKLKACNEDDDDNADDDDDDDDDADDQNDDAEEDKIPPWDEDNGIYGIMSRIVRNSPPTFIWCVRRDAVDVKALQKDQYINHYGKATFTTKVGLCINLRNTPWFEPVNPDSFFPRCYRLSHDEEKEAFIDDYKLTVCTSVLKWVRDHCADYPATEAELNSNKQANTPSKDNVTQNKQQNNTSPAKVMKKKKKGAPLPMKLLDVSLEQCHRYIRFQGHDDLDDPTETELLIEVNWEQMFQWYYALVHDEDVIVGAHSKLPEINDCLDLMKPILPQLDLDGHKNIWIVKPGAKSRGRGITLYDRLDEMLKLVNSSVVKKDSKFVVQKYIEQPLLIHNTKFDIRQWFLVTDWNPLTLWFYKDCYLRFCSQEYTLEMLDESIHLSNNSIQKNYSNGTRSSDLPDDNMWSSDQFKSFLKNRGQEHRWDEVVYPNMKEAVICSILSTQDIVEYRKSAFELYGADFMLTEDLKPWLIEINSSPCMSYSTKVTAELCAAVLEDTVKVVLDRKMDKNADTGRFELAYKQTPVAVPPYIGINLSVDGQLIKKPSWASPKKEFSPIRHVAIRTSQKDNVSLTSKSQDKTSSSNKKDSIDLSPSMSSAKSHNKSNLNSGGGKKSPTHGSKSHASQKSKSVTVACAPSTTVIPFNPCPPTKKKRSPHTVTVHSDQEVDPDKSPLSKVSTKSRTTESNGDTSNELRKESITESKKHSINETSLNSPEVSKNFEQELHTNILNDSNKAYSKEAIKDGIPIARPQKIVTFPMMAVHKAKGQNDQAKLAKSMPDAFLKDSIDPSALHSKEPKSGVVEGSWAVEENNNYIFEPETVYHIDSSISAKDRKMNYISKNGLKNPKAVIEMIQQSVMRDNSGFKRHWHTHRGGYLQRSSLKKYPAVQLQKSPVLDNPDCPVLLLNQSRIYSMRPGSSTDSRTFSPEYLSAREHTTRPGSSYESRTGSPDHSSPHFRVNSQHPSCSSPCRPRSPDPSIAPSLVASPTLSRSSKKSCSQSSKHNATCITVTDLQSHQGNGSNNTTFPGFVSRYITRKALKNSIDIAIDYYKPNSKLTVINPSFL